MISSDELVSITKNDLSPIPTVSGIPSFINTTEESLLRKEVDSTLENSWKNFFKQWPGLYDWLVFLLAPCFFTGVSSKKFLERFSPTSRVLHAGSGTHILKAPALNLDVFPFAGVDVIADLRNLPFKSHVFDGATCDQVLEHLSSPHEVANSLVRVVKPGGLIHIATPFVFPWHPSPSDYFRFTLQGLSSLFPTCSVVEKGIMAGPCSACNGFVAAFLATIFSFGSVRLQVVLQYFFLVVFSPIKFFDFVFARLPGAELVAANLYIIVRTPDA